VAVRALFAGAPRAAGRAPQEIKLLAVTKYVGVEEARALVEAGCLDLAESRPQELWHKARQIADPRVRWHLVGHLQRNKVRRTLPLVALLHSVDSLRLLRTIDEESQSLGRITPVLLEVNISGDAAKHGFSPAEMPDVMAGLRDLRNAEVCGLMGMASLEGDLAAARRDFARLRALRDELRAAGSGARGLEQLSMGMSGDLEAAIAEGATIVRVGSALFEGLDR
jgi:pyridoxal phosphate enzyme (YggS family)